MLRSITGTPQGESASLPLPPCWGYGDATMVASGLATTSPRSIGSNELRTVQSAEFYRQANAIGRSAQELNLTEKRVIVLALGRIDHTVDTPDIEVVVPLRLLGEHGIDNPYDRAKAAAHSLSGRNVVIPRDDGGFKAFPWLRFIEYVPAEDSDLGFSYVRLHFNEELRPWITNLRSHYAMLPIDEVLQLPSAFAIRLYEVLWHVSMGGRRPEIEMDIPSLKFALGLIERNSRDTGWKNERYKDWRDFRKQLKTALATFEGISSITATFKGVRLGRKIGSVRFTIEVVKPIPHLGMQPALFDSEPGDAPSSTMARILTRLKALKFTGNAQRLLDEHGLDTVEAAIAITERKAREGALTSPGGFFRTLLKDGTARQEAAAQKQEAETAATPHDEDEDHEALVSAWESHRRETAATIAAAEELSDDEVIEIVRSNLRGQASAKVVLASLEQNSWRGPVFDTYRTTALLERFPDLTPATAVDFDTFCEHHEAPDD